MPLFFIQWLVAGFGMAMASLLGRLLVALGVTYVTYSGVSVVSDWLWTQIVSSFGMMPLAISQFLGFLWFDKALSWFLVHGLLRWRSRSALAALLQKWSSNNDNDAHRIARQWKIFVHAGLDSPLVES
jgi:hypothetical protein